MIEKDTVRLLRECDAGVKMGVDSIESVLGRVHAKSLHTLLNESKNRHTVLHREIQSRLDWFQDEGRDPNPMASRMARAKTGVRMALGGTDRTVADLMTDGCNMGVKSLSRYLNQYEAAEEYSKDIAKKLIHMEAQLAEDLRPYL